MEEEVGRQSTDKVAMLEKRSTYSSGNSAWGGEYPVGPSCLISHVDTDDHRRGSMSMGAGRGWSLGQLQAVRRGRLQARLLLSPLVPRPLAPFSLSPAPPGLPARRLRLLSTHVCQC